MIAQIVDNNKQLVVAGQTRMSDRRTGSTQNMRSNYGKDVNDERRNEAKNQSPSKRIDCRRKRSRRIPSKRSNGRSSRIQSSKVSLSNEDSSEDYQPKRLSDTMKDTSAKDSPLISNLLQCEDALDESFEDSSFVNNRNVDGNQQIIEKSLSSIRHILSRSTGLDSSGSSQQEDHGRKKQLIEASLSSIRDILISKSALDSSGNSNSSSTPSDNIGTAEYESVMTSIRDISSVFESSIMDSSNTSDNSEDFSNSTMFRHHLSAAVMAALAASKMKDVAVEKIEAEKSRKEDGNIHRTEKTSKERIRQRSNNRARSRLSMVVEGHEEEATEVNEGENEKNEEDDGNHFVDTDHKEEEAVTKGQSQAKQTTFLSSTRHTTRGSLMRGSTVKRHGLSTMVLNALLDSLASLGFDEDPIDEEEEDSDDSDDESTITDYEEDSETIATDFEEDITTSDLDENITEDDDQAPKNESVMQQYTHKKEVIGLPKEAVMIKECKVNSEVMTGNHQCLQVNQEVQDEVAVVEDPIVDDDRMMIETTPSRLFKRGRRGGSSGVQVKVIIRGEDIDDTIKLLDMAMDENPCIEWVELYGLELSDSLQDIRLAKAVSKYHKRITKLCLYETHVLCSIYTNPSFLKAVSTKMSALEEFEISMADQNEVPYPFLISLVENSSSSKINSLILRNVAIYDYNQLSLLYESLVCNRQIKRFELWDINVGDDVSKFVDLTSTLLRYNTVLEKVLIEHLSGEHCSTIATATLQGKRKCKMKELTFHNVRDVQNAMTELLMFDRRITIT